jgi:hypothetical protein
MLRGQGVCSRQSVANRSFHNPDFRRLIFYYPIQGAPEMPRAKSPSSGKTNRSTTKDQAAKMSPVIPDGNPIPAEALSSNSEPEVKAAPETRKFELHKTEPRKNVVPINVEDEIRRRAYELSQQRGQDTGSPAEDWLAAEREVMQRYRQQRA